MPGEWFYSRASRRLYLWPNNTAIGEPPPEDVPLVVPLLTELIRIDGTQQSPVTNITIENVFFRDAAATYMEPHGVPSGGDWALQRTAAVVLNGTEHVTMRGCAFVRVDGNAILLTGYNRFAEIRRCEFAWIGDTAVAGWGDTDEDDGSGGEQPRHTLLADNFAHDVGIWEKQSSMWFQARTCQTTLTNNIFFNGPRAAINFNDGFGGANNVSDNLIFNQCRESGDHGPINSWDRMQFKTRVRFGDQLSYDPAVSVVARNFGIGDYGASQVFDTDDGSSWYHIHHNFFYDADLTKMDYGGHDSLIADNVVVVRQYDSQNCYMYNWPFLPGTGHTVINNKCVVGYGDLIGGVACDPKRLDDSVMVRLYNNQYFTKNGTARIVCYAGDGEHNVSLARLQEAGVELGSTLTTVPLADTILAWARDVLHM